MTPVGASTRSRTCSILPRGKPTRAATARLDADEGPLAEKLRKNEARRRNRLRHHRQVICLHWWGTLQLANARLRAHFFTASEGRGSDGIADTTRLLIGAATGVPTWGRERSYQEGRELAMTAIEIGEDLAQLDAAIEALPDQPAVFLVWANTGEPYLSRTGVLRRRLRRLIAERERPSRWLNLRHTAVRIEYRLTGSALESSILFYEQARRHFPDTYLRLMKLRMPPYVKLVLNNEFPRSHITTHLTRTAGLYFGPFRSRVSAERFEAQFLDLFQMRRCQEDLVPSPAHPGCIYGEMAMCLRPCQQVVGAAEYATEIGRVAEFLRTDGRSLLESIGHSRDRLSQEMLFEDAARQHKRYEKVQDVLRLRDELARDVDRLNGVAITPS